MIVQLLDETKEDQEMPVASLYLHPRDRDRKPTFSENVTTNNVVFKITVPKRTGRKRKRGEFGPYQDSTDENQPKPSLTSRDTRYLLRTLQDNVGKYEIQPVGVVHETHRFRRRLGAYYSVVYP